jgi:hypothetical protein
VTTTEKRWRERVAAWARSGLSCKEYAAKAGVHPGTLAGWKSKLASRKAVEPCADFVEVTEQLAADGPEDGVIELVVGKAVVRVRGRIGTEALTRVLDVLEARA